MLAQKGEYFPITKGKETIDHRTCRKKYPLEGTNINQNNDPGEEQSVSLYQTNVPQKV
jgi:hypothetical protein